MCRSAWSGKESAAVEAVERAEAWLEKMVKMGFSVPAKQIQELIQFAKQEGALRSPARMGDAQGNEEEFSAAADFGLSGQLWNLDILARRREAGLSLYLHGIANGNSFLIMQVVFPGAKRAFAVERRYFSTTLFYDMRKHVARVSF